MENNQTGADKTWSGLCTLMAHKSRYVGVTLMMVNWPEKEEEMRIRVS